MLLPVLSCPVLSCQRSRWGLHIEVEEVDDTLLLGVRPFGGIRTLPGGVGTRKVFEGEEVQLPHQLALQSPPSEDLRYAEVAASAPL